MPTFSLRTLSLVLVATGCGSVVRDDPPADDGAPTTSGGTGAATSTANGSTNAATASVGASSSSSGTGGAPDIPPLACASGETVFVAATAQGSAQAALVVGDSWFSFWNAQPLSALFAYVDPYRRFGVVANDTEGIPHLWREEEPGLLVEYETSFAPRPPFLGSTSLGSGFGPLLTQGVNGWRVGWYDADTQDWFAEQQLNDVGDWTPTSVTMHPQTGVVSVVGRTFAGDVCARETDANGLLGPLSCVPGVVSPTSEIPNTGPQILSLADGTQVILFMSQAAGALSAVTRNGGAWSAAATVTSDLIGIAFAATPSATGDVVVGALSTGGELSLLRFAGSWVGPSVIGSGYETWPIAAGPGACGADAFIGVTQGGSSVDVARVYGTQAAIAFALPFGDDFASDIRFAVRGPVR